MRRPRLTEEQRQYLLEQIQERKSRELLYKRLNRLYNRKYRKSPAFIYMWVVRIIYIAMFFIIVFADSISGGFTSEIVKNNQSDTYWVTNSGRRSVRHSYQETRIKFTTNRSYYTAYFRSDLPPYLSNGDTIRIERDIFNKPIYFTKTNWDYKYPITSYLAFNLCILNLFLVIFTLISFAFNDGLYKFNNQVFIFISSCIAISTFIYLLYRLYYLIFS